MAYTLGQYTLTPHTLGLAHIFGTGIYLTEHLLHLRLADTSHRICLHHFAQLLQAELHVVEVLDGLAQLNRDVCQHGLKVTESLSCSATAFGVHRLLGNSIGYENHNTPILPVDQGIELV